MSHLGEHLRTIKLKSSLFGNKPEVLELYTEGLELKSKKSTEAVPFNAIQALKTSDYFLPNALHYAFDLITTEGTKTSFVIPFVQKDDAHSLLITHARFVLDGEQFPENLMTLTVTLNEFVTWDKGLLIAAYKNNRKDYTLSELEAYIEKNGLYTFKLVNSNKTIPISVTEAPNCLVTVNICRAIGELLAPSV